MSKKKYDDDDGRVIADMSGVTRQPVFIPRIDRRENKNAQPETEDKDERPWEDKSLNRTERRSFIFGALGATLLVGSVFAIAAFLVILMMTKLW